MLFRMTVNSNILSTTYNDGFIQFRGSSLIDWKDKRERGFCFMKIVSPNVEIISMDDYSTILKKIERIGRVCYKSEENITDVSAERFIAGLIRRGHESVIEHEAISVRITCDRGVTHEIVRHRIASYSQESTRYCNYSNDKFDNQITVIDPCGGFSYDLTKREDLEKYETWKEAMDAAEKYYFKLLKLGADPQEARSVLPNSLKTEIVVTMNLREWRHFFRLRTSLRAHPQMRQVATMVYEAMVEKLPVFFQDIQPGV